MRPLSIIACILLMADSAPGALRFERDRVEIHARPEQVEVSAEYPFVNAGERAVTITSIDTGCDCTTAHIDKKTYAPGEKGTLKVTFDFGQRVGVQDKPVTIVTDQGNAQVRLLVHIPEILSATPRLVWWRKGEREPKTIVLEPAEGVALKLSKTEAGPGLMTKLEAIDDGKRYRLTITPAGDASPGTTTITIYGELAGKPRTFSVFAKIMAE